MRTLTTILIIGLLAGLVPLGPTGASASARDDGFIARIEFEGAVPSAAGTVVPVDPEGQIIVRVQAFHRVGVHGQYLPFNSTFGLAFYHGELNDGVGGVRFSDEGRLARVVDTDDAGKATIVVQAEALRDFEGVGPGNGFAVSLIDCSPNAGCRTSFHSWTTNALIDDGLHRLADVAEYREPNSQWRPTATTVFVVKQ